MGIVDGVTEQIGGGSGQWRVQICSHGRNGMMLEQSPERDFTYYYATVDCFVC